MKKLQKNPRKTFKYLIGIDEVGRGPVAGPVAVCAAIISFEGTRHSTQKIKDIFKNGKSAGREKMPILRDSKRLTKRGRGAWFNKLVANESIFFSLQYASAKEIDKKGISVCIKTLVDKNLKKLQEKINFKNEEVLILLDGGLKAPLHFINQETIIGGDDKEPIISFASIYAKVNRDKFMTRLSMLKKYQNYGFEKHKGYGTKAHMEAIKTHGISDLHRETFLKK